MTQKVDTYIKGDCDRIRGRGGGGGEGGSNIYTDKVTYGGSIMPRYISKRVFHQICLDEKQNGSHREDIEKLGSKDKNYSDMTAGEDLV